MMKNLKKRGDMYDRGIQAKVEELPPMNSGEVESRIKTHAVRTLGKGASYYGSKTGPSLISNSLNHEAKRDLLNRVREPIARLRSELGIAEENK